MFRIRGKSKNSKKYIIIILICASLLFNLLTRVNYNITNITFLQIIFVFSSFAIIILPYMIITKFIIPSIFKLKSKSLQFSLRLLTGILYGAVLYIYEVCKVEIFGEDISGKSSPFLVFIILWIILLIFNEKPK